MIINSPNNPTGSVLSRDELEVLAKVAVERDLIVISDEVYEKILYDDAKHYCVLRRFRGAGGIQASHRTTFIRPARSTRALESLGGEA
jgi:DNA-binding transcriptional MocR family regulator